MKRRTKRFEMRKFGMTRFMDESGFKEPSTYSEMYDVMTIFVKNLGISSVAFIAYARFLRAFTVRQPGWVSINWDFRPKMPLQLSGRTTFWIIVNQKEKK